MRKELRRRLAKEYRYAANKMQESQDPLKKLFYFTVLFGEAQRVLNIEWDRDLTLVHMVTQQAHNHIRSVTLDPVLSRIFPINLDDIYGQLNQSAFDFAAYFDKTTSKASTEELFAIVARIAEITYSVTGNGSYLREKEHIKS